MENVVKEPDLRRGKDFRWQERRKDSSHCSSPVRAKVGKERGRLARAEL